MFVDYAPYLLMILCQIVGDFLFFQQKSCNNIFLKNKLNILNYHKLCIVFKIT